ncbi:aminoglycoside phosphotransferase family protein [Streptacidiphilus sp. 4-A2]|nr:aminoglycoside phosphotransferase family protein [Streptacidiphilus sp. 4-A2]
MDGTPSVELLDIAAAALPGISLDRAGLAGGQFHEVVLLPGTAVVRIARTPAASAALPRRVELLRRLAAAGLPFAVPEPLSPVVTVGGRAAVALTWLDGAPAAKGEGGEPTQLAALLEAMRGVDLTALADVLGRPHEFAGGDRWGQLMLEEVVPRIPEEWRAEARRRVQAALDLPPVTPSLVHGDLGGGNMHWDPSGRLIGVLDWDLAQPFDPAVDAACLAWHGWDRVRDTVDARTLDRAGTWYLTFGLEQITVQLLDGAPEEAVAARVQRATAWMAGNHGWRPPHH